MENENTKHEAMTPKTQRVCKHCQQEIRECTETGPDSTGQCKGYVHTMNGSHFCDKGVAEPASTGEPPEKNQECECGTCEYCKPLNPKRVDRMAGIQSTHHSDEVSPPSSVDAPAKEIINPCTCENPSEVSPCIKCNPKPPPVSSDEDSSAKACGAHPNFNPNCLSCIIDAAADKKRAARPSEPSAPPVSKTLCTQDLPFTSKGDSHGPQGPWQTSRHSTHEVLQTEAAVAHGAEEKAGETGASRDKNENAHEPIAAPQTSAEPCFRGCTPTKDRKLCADNSGLVITWCLCECHDIPDAAPQPVSGDAPAQPKESMEEWWRQQYLNLLAFMKQNRVGDAPKVEEIAAQIQRKVYDLWQHSHKSSRSSFGQASYQRFVLEGALAILRPYFPPASQTPHAERMLELIAKRVGYTNQDEGLIDFIVNRLATPASTARTDAIQWPQSVPPSEFSMEFVQYMANRMAFSFFRYGHIANAYPDKVNALESLELRLKSYRETRNTEFLVDAANFCMIEFMLPSIAGAEFIADRHESPGRVCQAGYATIAKNSELAAPGSVPQAPKDECLYGPVGKHIFNPHDDEPRRCINCGVPQAEPPKEEKP